MEVKTLAVVGAGQMGAGIAQVAAQSGISVVLIDVNADLVEKGVAGIRAQLDRAVSKGKMKADDAKVTPDMTSHPIALWAMAWRARSAAWMIRNRRALETALNRGAA